MITDQDRSTVLYRKQLAVHLRLMRRKGQGVVAAGLARVRRALEKRRAREAAEEARRNGGQWWQKL